MRRYVVIGGGIVGLATARALNRAEPSARVTVLEKETGLARHQSGRNSGVLHSGVYYPAGSAKALMCRSGAAAMAAFAESHAIPVIRTGKLIVATDPAELPPLDRLYRQGLANGLNVSWLGPEQAREHEPFVSALAAVRVPGAAITDYSAICAALAAELVEAGVGLRLGAAVTGLRRLPDGATVVTESGPVPADVVINCAGLQSDRIADLDAPAGTADPADCRIVPFRGEYYELRPDRRHLVKGLIYPVPDPAFPFLGVHLTSTVDGRVHAGPNAVLALAREGYRRSAISPADVLELARFPGLRRLARRNLATGLAELGRSLSKQRFAAGLARLVPGITADDLLPSPAGVRAQALRRDGSLVEDFLIVRRGPNVHVLNAPSPAATCALQIGGRIAGLATVV
ncbi:MAG: L-2-hydroxyglutarate oxidase [Jatrophihabitantaceae bacterium]